MQKAVYDELKETDSMLKKGSGSSAVYTTQGETENCYAEDEEDIEESPPSNKRLKRSMENAIDEKLDSVLMNMATGNTQMVAAMTLIAKSFAAMAGVNPEI